MNNISITLGPILPVSPSTPLGPSAMNTSELDFFNDMVFHQHLPAPF